MLATPDNLTSVNLLTLILGPFVGATFAFYSSRLLDAAKRHRERVAAANLALFALKQQYNDFLLYRKSYREVVGRAELSGNEPCWAILKPSHMTFGNYAVDLKGISFLYERSGRAEAFDCVEEAQICYRDIVSLANVANQCAQKIQELAVKEERNHPGITLLQLEPAIGMDLVGQMSMAVIGLGMRLSRDEAVYLKAFNVLRAALNSELNSGWVATFRNVWSPKGGATLVKIKAANPKFRLDALPPLPKALADAVASMLED
jgi:hypothetical protein